MNKFFYRSCVCAVLITALSFTGAYAGVNEHPQLMEWFKEENYEAIDKFIYDDQTGKIESTSQCEITVADDIPLWEASPYMLSNCTGVVWPFDDALFNGSEGLEISDEFKEFAPTMAQYPIMRIGFGNNANMLKLIGPMSQRTIGECVLTEEEQEIYMAAEPRHRSLEPDRVQKTGLLEMIEAAELMNPDIQFTLILSFVYATPEDNANLMKFLMDDPKESHWGALRAEYGHPAPVKVHSVELGNEVYIRKSYGEEEDKRQVDFYVKMFKAHADAMRQYYPDIGCSICLMCMDGEAHEIWNIPVLEQLGPYLMENYDENNRWISLHHYYSGYEMGYTQNRIQVMIDSLREMFGEEHHIRALFSEHSKWASDWIAPTTLESGLATCQFLNRMYQWDEMTSAVAHYFDWHSQNLWNTFRRSNKDGTLVRSGPDYMYKMYMENLGDRVFRSEVATLDDSEIGDINSSRQLYSVCAMGKGKNEMKLIMANRANNTDIDLKFNFNSGNGYTLIGEEIMTAPNIYSFPYSADTQDIFDITKTEKNIPNFSEYKMPAKAMVVLTLKSNKPIADIGGSNALDEEPVYEGEEVFNDIYNHWARNEINLLAQDGIINGTEEGSFRPDDKITRAEFAVLLSRIFNSDEDFSDKYISDVDNGEWYAGGVKKAVADGYMRGYGDGTFRPDREITLSEAVGAVYRALSDAAAEFDIDDYDIILEGVRFDSVLTDWEKECFASLIASNLFSKFYEERTVEKERAVTRAEAAVLLHRLKTAKGV